MKKAFSIFLFGDVCHIHELGYVVYDELEDDDATLFTIKNNVSKDLNLAQKISLESPISWLDEQSHQRIGSNFVMALLEPIFQKYHACENPLTCLTPVVNDVIDVKYQTDFSPLNIDDFDPPLHCQPDWMQFYRRESNELDLPALINDDLFIPVKFMFNNNRYISAMKLMFSAIDTISYLEYGSEERNPFLKWLDSYVDLSEINITAPQLWELRNSLLHMTNGISRKVMNGQEVQLVPYVGKIQTSCFLEDGKRYFNIKEFTKLIARGCEKWLETYNNNTERLGNFIKRYDTILSDERIKYKIKLN